jgi:hypothetical protein
MAEMHPVERPRREYNRALEAGKIIYGAKNIHRDEGDTRDRGKVEAIPPMISPSSLSSL